MTACEIDNCKNAQAYYVEIRYVSGAVRAANVCMEHTTEVFREVIRGIGFHAIESASFNPAQWNAWAPMRSTALVTTDPADLVARN